MQTIPLLRIPSQTIQVVLGNQTCSLAVYVKNQCMFFDMAVNGVQVASAIQVSNLVNVVPTAYLGFTGWLLFMDTQGEDDPVYTGLGTRWQLLYLDAEDLLNYGIAA